MQVGFQAAPAARAPDAINGNAEHRADEDDEIERAHENIFVSAMSSATQKTKLPRTKI